MSAPSSERGGIQRVIRALRADGWQLNYVWDGGERIPVSTEPQAIEEIESTGVAHLYVKRGQERGWVFFVLGNDPDEVVNDFTVNLAAVERETNSWWE